MRLIDGDKLIQSICNTADLGGWIGDTLLQIKKLAINYIHSAPSIDIVRCGECKHWDDRRNDAWWSNEGACNRTSRLGDATYRNHDDFCSRGERKDDE